jgi:hypothetical protein
LTGAGAFLQTIINGWAGLQYTAAGLTVTPRLPSNTSSITVAGVHLAGASLQVELVRGGARVVLLRGVPPLQPILAEEDTGINHDEQQQQYNSSSELHITFWPTANATEKKSATMEVGKAFLLPEGREANITVHSGAS